jgi:hypothetical protein
VFVYGAVFAPTKLSTTIVHVWERYDDEEDAWREVGRIPFSIVGGRDGGYRGYSLKQVTEGRYRVYVETQSGLVIGYISFIVEPGSPKKLGTVVD